jgi:hypothetical protein
MGALTSDNVHIPVLQHDDSDVPTASPCRISSRR